MSEKKQYMGVNFPSEMIEEIDKWMLEHPDYSSRAEVLKAAWRRFSSSEADRLQRVEQEVEDLKITIQGMDEHYANLVGSFMEDRPPF